MDDLIIMAPDRPMALLHCNWTLSLLKGLGRHINKEKSSLEPAQSKEFLGMTVNTLDTAKMLGG
jgi:hypothetical protein